MGCRELLLLGFYGGLLLVELLDGLLDGLLVG